VQLVVSTHDSFLAALHISLFGSSVTLLLWVHLFYTQRALVACLVTLDKIWLLATPDISCCQLLSYIGLQILVVSWTRLFLPRRCFGGIVTTATLYSTQQLCCTGIACLSITNNLYRIAVITVFQRKVMQPPILTYAMH